MVRAVVARITPVKAFNFPSYASIIEDYFKYRNKLRMLFSKRVGLRPEIPKSQRHDGFYASSEIVILGRKHPPFALKMASERQLVKINSTIVEYNVASARAFQRHAFAKGGGGVCAKGPRSKGFIFPDLCGSMALTGLAADLAGSAVVTSTY